jgi:hypothetical protein
MSNHPHLRHRSKPKRKPPCRIVIVTPDACSVPGCEHHHGGDLEAAWQSEADFGYTVGLWTDHGLPELYASASPTPVDSPHFIPQTMDAEGLGGMLEFVVTGYLAGHIGPGRSHTFDVRNDHTLTLDLGEPRPRDELDAFQTHPLATVVPVSWHAECHHPQDVA